MRYNTNIYNGHCPPVQIISYNNSSRRHRLDRLRRLLRHRLPDPAPRKRPTWIDIRDELMLQQIPSHWSISRVLGQTPVVHEIEGDIGEMDIRWQLRTRSFVEQLRIVSECWSYSARRTSNMAATCSISPHGLLPVHISSTTHPRLQMSTLPEYVRSFAE